MSSLKASIFVLPEPGRRMPASDLWAEMAAEVVAEFAEDYILGSRGRDRVCITREAVSSPDRAVIRYRTIEARIRRRAGEPTLLDLSVGNLFSLVSSSNPEPVHVVNDPRYAQWARHAGQVPLGDHVRLIQQFAGDLQDAGWGLEQARLAPLQIPAPQVRNGNGARALPTEKFHQLVRRPAAWPTAGMDIAIVAPGGGRTDRAAAQITQAMEALFGRSTPWAPRILAATEPNAGAVSLMLLDDHSDLADLHDLRQTLRGAEAQGYGFKLAKLGSLSKPYPAQNIAYDLFLIAGGRPWMPVEPQPAFTSLDAGHDSDRARSRWVKVETNASHGVTNVQAFDTELAEHVPSRLLAQLWPMDAQAVLCRDGRLSRERAAFESRAAAERRPMIEAKKSPKAILWRESEDGASPALFGDAVLDEHGELLLQTVRQNIGDYVHPVRLAIQGGDAVGLATAFLHQQAVPPLSLFHMSRLPGALYFADLVSKLTSDGWPKAVGRGFKVPEIIP
jgi:hypothetical protein